MQTRSGQYQISGAERGIETGASKQGEDEETEEGRRAKEKREEQLEVEKVSLSPHKELGRVRTTPTFLPKL